jgi:hypothetical protein
LQDLGQETALEKAEALSGMAIAILALDDGRMATIEMKMFSGIMFSSAWRTPARA